MTSQERFWQARLLSSEAEHRSELSAIHQQLAGLKATTEDVKADLLHPQQHNEMIVGDELQPLPETQQKTPPLQVLYSFLWSKIKNVFSFWGSVKAKETKKSLLKLQASFLKFRPFWALHWGCWEALGLLGCPCALKRSVGSWQPLCSWEALGRFLGP
jgi:hypothetical protein